MALLGSRGRKICDRTRELVYSLRTIEFVREKSHDHIIAPFVADARRFALPSFLYKAARAVTGDSSRVVGNDAHTDAMQGGRVKGVAKEDILAQAPPTE